MPTKSFPGDFSSLAQISEFIAENTKLAGFDEKTTYAVQLAVDEACSNIIEHAYGKDLQGDIECTCSLVDEGIQIVLRDRGRVFTPEDVPEIEIGVPLDEFGERGAGVFLMNKLMDEVRYEFSKTEGTTLTMTKKK
jgi:serine/threonine-protein kinase RsbW